MIHEFTISEACLGCIRSRSDTILRHRDWGRPTVPMIPN